MSASGGSRTGELDGLRAIALMIVVETHFGLPGQEHGYIALESFFALSGYLITRNLLRDRPSFRQFYSGRALRLLPALFAWLLLTAALQGFAPGAEQPDGKYWALSALNLTAWGVVLTGGWMGYLAHTWSLSVEESFYVLWPVILLVLRRRRREMALLITLALAVACYASGFLAYSTRPDGRVPDAYYLAPCRSGGILLGCALALWLQSRPSGLPEWTRWATAAPVPWLLWAGAVLLDGNHSFAQDSFLTTLPLSDFATLSLILGTQRQNAQRWDRRVLRFAPLRALGKASYSIYLWHYPVMAMTRPISVDLHVRYAIPIRCVAFLIPGLLSYWAFERPYLNRQRRTLPAASDHVRAATAANMTG